MLCILPDQKEHIKGDDGEDIVSLILRTDGPVVLLLEQSETEQWK